MDARIHLITLGVMDVARSRAFYEALGWCASSASVESTVFFQLGGGLALALWSREALAADANLDAGSGFGGFALAQNMRSREQVDQLLRQAEAAGGRIIKPAENKDWGGYSGYFADPDGHAWEIAFNPHFQITEVGSLSLPD